jgi:hypothetical protein
MKLFKINFLVISDPYCQLFLRRSNKNSLLFKSKFQYFYCFINTPEINGNTKYNQFRYNDAIRRCY